MSITTITGTEIGPILVNSANNTYNIKAGATLVLGGNPDNLESLGTIMENIDNPSVNHDNVYNIDGRLIGLQVGIFTAGDRDQITVGATGKVIGNYGIAFQGSKTEVTNNGEIVAGGGDMGGEGAGILAFQSTAAEIHNNGMVSGTIGIHSDGTKTLIVNGEHGFVTGSMAGIVATFGDLGQTAAAAQLKSNGPSVEVINHGMVLSSGDGAFAFAAVDVNVSLTNDGTLQGDVNLGDGDSLFDNRGGKVIGSIVGGGGDDVLIVDSAKYKLHEEAAGGDDTVKSTVNYKLSANVETLVLIGNKNIHGIGAGGDETLEGNAGNNTLNGKGGADELFGAKGNDKLYGGAGNDEFHFATGGGNDKIMDFKAAESDKIDFSGWDAVDSLAKVKGHAEDQGGDVLISAGDDSVLIVGMHKADLSAGFFDFAS